MGKLGLILMSIGATSLFLCGGCNAETPPKQTTQELTQKAASGDKEAMQTLEKLVVEKAKAEKKALKDKAKAGDPLAAFQAVYMAGKDVNQLAQDGNPNAQLHIARTTADRAGLSPTDAQKLRENLEKISSLNESFKHQTLSSLTYPLAGEAAFIISEDYLGASKLYPMDNTQAVSWLTKAANLGQPEAMFKLGTRYQYGLDMDTNLDMAQSWLKKSADAGWRQAAQELAKLEAK